MMKRTMKVEWWLIGILVSLLLAAVGWTYNSVEVQHRHLQEQVERQALLTAQFGQYINDSTARLERIENKLDALR